MIPVLQYKNCCSALGLVSCTLNYVEYWIVFLSFREPKGIASAHQLKLLLGTQCKVSGCTKPIKIDVSQVGYCLKLKWVCTIGHRDVWYSGRIYSSGKTFVFLLEKIIKNSPFLLGTKFSLFTLSCLPWIGLYFDNLQNYI